MINSQYIKQVISLESTFHDSQIYQIFTENYYQYLYIITTNRQFNHLQSINISDLAFMTLYSPKSSLQFGQNNTQLQQQVHNLKQKAHKSFLQLMQIQQLHKQEVDQLNIEHQQYVNQSIKKEQQLNQKIKDLEDQIAALKKKQDINKQPFFQILQQQSIQPIQFKEDSRTQESFYQIKQIFGRGFLTQQSSQQYLCYDIKKELEPLILKSQLKTFQKILLQNFLTIFSNTKQENQSLREKLVKIEQQKKGAQIQISKLQKRIESKKKQIAFLSDHIRKGHNQRIELQKKIEVLQKALLQNFEFTKKKMQKEINVDKNELINNNDAKKQKIKPLKSSQLFKSIPIVPENSNIKPQSSYCEVKSRSENIKIFKNFLRKANENK